MPTTSWPAGRITPRARVITDNDYGGDPDGLVELAHLMLSPAVQVSAVIGSRARADDGWDASIDRSLRAARTVVDLTGRTADVPVVAGADHALIDHSTAAATAAVDVILAEALRDDTDLPLYVTCGAGLTQIASAWLTDPRIGSRLTLVWIGGSEHAGHATPPPGQGSMEYNLDIDTIAGQVVFNLSDITIWQVPRNVYRTVLVSTAELLTRLAPHGELGRHLFESIGSTVTTAAQHGFDLGETYILGDSPLVLLTALQSSFHPDGTSSTYVTMPCPNILDSGEYRPEPDGRPMRVYTAVDSRVLLEDLYAKLQLHGAPTPAGVG
jgi:inosine-uridine nucleoside N-ribohydrolase